MAARFWVGGTGTWDNSTTTHWASSTGGAGGASVPGSGDAVTFDANSGGGTVTPNYNFTVTSITMGAFTGTLDFSANNNSPTMGTFNCSGTGTRTLNMGSGTWNITTNNTTIWNITTTTNLTFNANGSTLQFSYSGSTGTRTTSTGTGLTYNNILITAGSDIFSFPVTIVLNGNLSTSGFTGTFSKGSASINIKGNLTVGAGSVWSSSGSSVTFSGTGTSNVNLNGVNVNQVFNVNSTGTVNLLSDVDVSGPVIASFTITVGVFNTNNFNIKAALFSSNNTNTRTINLGSSLITLTGTGVVFTMGTTTGLTFNAGTSTFKITDTSSSSKTVSIGPVTMYKMWFTGGTGIFVIGVNSATNTFNNLKIDAGSTVQIFAGKTLVIGSVTISGSAGNINTFKSTSNGTAWFLSMVGLIKMDYISFQDCYATGGAWYYATPNAVNVSGNSGLIFLPIGTAGNFLELM